MSDVISAWVDQDEMRRLAESLLSRPYGHEMRGLEVDFGSKFEGFAAGVGAVETPAVQPASRPNVEPDPTPELVNQASQIPEQAASTQPSHLELERTTQPASGPSPSVVRSAVQFLKKAQAEGKAGGVIRAASKPPMAAPPVSPSNIPAVNVASPPEPQPRAIHSPFRRVNDVEPEAPNESIAEMVAASVEPKLTHRLKRPPVPSGDDPILARVTQFGKWLKGPVGAQNFFVSNTEGKLLIDEVGNPKLIQVARSLAGASGEASAGEIGGLHVRIGEDSILEVVPTPSQFGTLILGLIVEHPLPDELIREVRLGLEEVANARLIRAQGSR